MTTEKGASEILEKIRSIYVPTHRFDSVRLEDFKRVPIRCMVSQDGAIMSAIYHPRLSSPWLRAPLFPLRKRIDRIIDFETEFSDGSFVCTTDALSAGAMESPPLHREIQRLNREPAQ